MTLIIFGIIIYQKSICYMDGDYKILIAEDNPGHASLIMKNLSRASINNEIKHFFNGKDLLDYLENYILTGSKERFIVLLDIRMPVVDGVTALKKIKEHPRLKNIPVIMFTTTDDPNEIRLCKEIGSDSYLVKPINYDKFTEVVFKLGIFLKTIEIPVI